MKLLPTGNDLFLEYDPRAYRRAITLRTLCRMSKPTPVLDTPLLAPIEGETEVGGAVDGAIADDVDTAGGGSAGSTV